MDTLDYLEEYDKLKTKVLKYVLYKKRTEREVRQKFELSVKEELLEDVIEDLKENGYISDSIYVQRAINEFIALKNLSLKEIRYKLLAKGLSNDIIDEYFGENYDKLEEFEKKSIQNIYYKKQTTMQIEEIVQFLAKKGYKLDNIKEVLSEVE